MSLRSIDDILTSLAYKGNPSSHRASSSPSLLGGDQFRHEDTNTQEALHRPNSISPQTPPPLFNKTKRIKKSPSSYLRTTVAGKPVVVSRFFPLPPDASSPPLAIDKKGTEKIKTPRCASGEKKKRKKSVIADEGKVRKKEKKRQPSQLSAAEKMSDAYRRVAADSTWEPPPSCHKLLQERHSFDPWRVLIICMLLNITSGKQVGKVLPGLFLLCPDAETATKVTEEEIEKVIQTLGLQRKRARMIKRFSHEYLRSDWTHVTQLHGIGKYAADAYAIFCVGKPEEVVPQDHKLLDYWKFVCGIHNNEESDCAELVDHT
ncbi:uncharacterized protein [Typha angustifolia]|uniref:uncharacterized protein n=1 Tax=Typha angustifolia TaxID=59011 RepID=UPI003C305360